MAHTLHVLSHDQAPALDLAANQCLIVAEAPELRVGDMLEFGALGKVLTIVSITWVIGKLVPVDVTESGHRFIVEFDADDLPNDESGSHAFSKL